MADPYFNPTSALPDPGSMMPSLAGGGQLPTVFGEQAQASRQQTMAPFLQRAGEEDELALQKKRIEQREFSGESATNLREMTRRAELEKAKTTTENEPLDRQLKALRAQKDIARVDLEDEEKRGELHNKIIDNKAHPRVLLMGQLASVYKDIQDAKTPQDKIGIYDKAIKNFEATYGKLEEHGLSEFRYYSEHKDFQHQLDMIHSVMVHTALHQQKIEEEEAKARGQLTVAKEQTRGSAQVADIQQRGAMARQVEAENTGKNTEQRSMALRRLLADPKTPEARRQGLLDEQGVVERSIVDKQIASEIAKPDPTIMGMAGEAGQRALQTYTQHVDNRRIELLAARGIAPTIAEIKLATRTTAPDDKIKAIWNKAHPNAMIK